MLKKLYDNSKILFAVLWIVAYCVLVSLADSASAALGVEKSVTLAVTLTMSAVLLLFLGKYGLLAEYGLCPPRVSAGSMLYYLPLVLMLGANLCFGVKMNYGALETVLYILSMLCVGLLEELIFRGLLFGAMRENGLRSAIAVSSITFGIGHIINLINGSGMELVPNLLQVVYATSAGSMFVMIYYRSGSLVSCITAHGVFNALSAFASDAADAPEARILSAVLLAALTGLYALYLAIFVKPLSDSSKNDVGGSENDLHTAD